MDSLSSASSSDAVLVNRFKDIDLCLPECDFGQTEVDSPVSSDPESDINIVSFIGLHRDGLHSISLTEGQETGRNAANGAAPPGPANPAISVSNLINSISDPYSR